MATGTTRCFVLWLNSVYDKAEHADPVAIADTLEHLKDWEWGQRADTSYKEGQYHLVYKPGSPIQYFNPVENWDYKGGFPWPVTEEDVLVPLVPSKIVKIGIE